MQVRYGVARLAEADIAESPVRPLFSIDGLGGMYPLPPTETVHLNRPIWAVCSELIGL